MGRDCGSLTASLGAEHLSMKEAEEVVGVPAARAPHSLVAASSLGSPPPSCVGWGGVGSQEDSPDASSLIGAQKSH